ncbi:hypothetical protein SAMN05421862_1456 [Pseudomonas extremaustralis]|nr:hypothetical protein SAMN05421862_1456 [Pseudomonas extremaustralis]
MVFFPLPSKNYALLDFLFIHLFSDSWKISLTILRCSATALKLGEQVSQPISFYQVEWIPKFIRQMSKSNCVVANPSNISALR